MNLKLVVASMIVLGLVNCPVFAATHHAKHKHHPRHCKAKHHHHHRHHHHMVAEHRDYKDYKDMGPQLAPIEAPCMISQSSMVMDGMTQNVGRALPNPCHPGWFNRIQVSGGVNVDLGKWGNRNANLMGENYQRLSLNDAYLNVSATANEWARAFASISYNTATIEDPLTAVFLGKDAAEYSAAYSNNTTFGFSHNLQLEQAYATFGNLDASPLFFQVGQQFQDFSRYKLHPITESLTQVMSETLATSAKVGFITCAGFNGSISVFDDPLNKNGQSSPTTNYNIALGFDQPNDQLGYSVGAAYLYNMIGVNSIAYNVYQFDLGSASTGYFSKVSGVALYGDVNSGPFTIGARYTTAIQRFNPLDLPRYGTAGIGVVGASGAKPWSAGIQAGYGFDAFGANQNVYLGYQASRQTAGLNLPKNRWLVGYDVSPCKNTLLGIEWDHDTSFNVASGGTGRNTNLVTIRTGVQFS